MPLSAADLRFAFDRSLGLLRRGLVSLRSRGWLATWQRVRTLLPAQRAARGALWMPDEGPFVPFGVPSVPDDEAPRASIVIPVYGQCAHTLRCLRALAAHPPVATVEIIVVDDASPDAETRERLPQITGLRLHRRAQNGGFVPACNDGAALAQGDFLVFLNNDTVPQPGWLDALLATFEVEPAAGIVGARLLGTDGHLQESGGAVFADASARNLGRFADGDDPRFAWLREVDYVSGAALAIPRTLFAALGGFDARYAPGYYEDTDLAFAARAAGHKVLVQPAARVVHVEGATAGTDTTQGMKAYQVRNRDIFRERWAEALARQPAPEAARDERVANEAALLHRSRRQVLIVEAWLPRPDRDSGSLRLLNLMRLLREEGADVCLVALEEGDAASAEAAAEPLRREGIEVWHGRQLGALPAWLRRHGPRFTVAMACRCFVAHGVLPLLRRFAPQARAVFDTVDLHHVRERRGAEVAGDRALLRAAERTRVQELAAVAAADITLVVSDSERALLAEAMPDARIALVSNLHRIAGSGAAFEERRDLLFVGGFRHPPNTDAMRWCIEAILPRIRAALPGVTLHCIGADPPDDLLARDGRDGLRIHGHVPDLAPWLDGTRIALAPLRYGAGVKGKVNQSMAHGLPVVATGCAVEAMHLRDGEDVLVADEADAFADAVVRLYRDQALWERLAAYGLASVQQHFSPAAARGAVREVFFARR